MAISDDRHLRVTVQNTDQTNERVFTIRGVLELWFSADIPANSTRTFYFPEGNFAFELDENNNISEVWYKDDKNSRISGDVNHYEWVNQYTLGDGVQTPTWAYGYFTLDGQFQVILSSATD